MKQTTLLITAMLAFVIAQPVSIFADNAPVPAKSPKAVDAEPAESKVQPAPKNCPACAMGLTAEFVFNRLDADQDKTVTATEFQRSPGMNDKTKAAEAVARIDTDANGTLTWEEFQTAYKARHADCEKPDPAAIAANPENIRPEDRGDGTRFAQVFIMRSDKDGDSRISKSEFRGGDAAFERMDKNKNGFIEPDELGELHQRRLADPKTMRQRIDSGNVDYMRDTIRDYRTTDPNQHRLLHLVYFHPEDVEPQTDFRERIARIMNDIQSFYRSEMKRNGFGDVTFPLDMVEGKPRIHLVKGRDPSAEYHHESGRKAIFEIEKSLAGKLNLSREFVLIFHGMCQERDDGSYFFHAPYYGMRSSNHQRGLCHVADCELQDTNLLTDTKRRIKYEEHTGKFDQSLAQFNVKYLGGIAHELGHALSLPHNGQTNPQRQQLGTALMGAGNHTYRREVLGGKGSFLTLASATRLASHPLFARSDRGVETPPKCKPGQLKFTEDNAELTIEGHIEATPQAYAVIAYVDPPGKADYDAISFVAPVRNGNFKIQLPTPTSAPHELRLVACHLNGATSQFHRKTSTNPQQQSANRPPPKKR